MHRFTTTSEMKKSWLCCLSLFCLWIGVSERLLLVQAFSMAASASPYPPSKPIPITVLSGFLGSGKTTLLQHLLNNKEGLKIGIVVNDVASVNIDSKLVKQREMTSSSSSDGMADEATALGGSDGMVELQNGCACCSLSDELLTSVSSLVTLSDLREQQLDEEDEDTSTAGGFDHIVIELSGVADPKAIRAKFQEAIMDQMPLMERVQLDTMVSLLDCSTFESHFQSTQMASPEEMPELYYKDGKAPDVSESEEEEEEWMQDMPPQLKQMVLSAMNAQNSPLGSAEASQEGVADLLVSQTETADLVVLNKIDLIDQKQQDRLLEIVAALNPRSKVLLATYGQVPLDQILGVAGGMGVSVAGAVDDHRDYVEAASELLDHSHEHSAASSTCTDPHCTDDSHSHSHDHGSSNNSHSHSHDHGSSDEACTDPTCTDESHSHSHSHSHSREAETCTDPNCTDDSHSHSHSHSHTDECSDPNCTDESHSHTHSHSHSDDTVKTRHGTIGTFVYKARRPFHPERLVSFLRLLPVVRGIPETSSSFSLNVPQETQDVLGKCLRSKGFCWSAHSHTDALYWSHAGASFELNCLGQWWATLPRDQWPPGVDDYVLQDFDDPAHDDATNNVGVGDRRQEIVFIGPGFGIASTQKAIEEVLTECLVTPEELEDYQTIAGKNPLELANRFESPLESRYIAY